MFGLTRSRLVEIGVALLLTLAALLFVGLTVWAGEMARLHVTDAWVRPTIGETRVTAAYMTIMNHGEAGDVLKGASAPKVKSIELHETSMTPEGVMQMRKIEGGLPIEAGAMLVLAPGGTHFMLTGLENALAAGERLILTLEFAKAGDVEVSVPVAAAAPGAATSEEHSVHH